MRLSISGRVQGVWYRASTRDAAKSLGLSGWVRNLPDGRVEAMAEGDAVAVDQLLAWCRKGPPGARIDAIEVVDEPPTLEQGGFHVRRCVAELSFSPAASENVDSTI